MLSSLFKPARQLKRKDNIDSLTARPAKQVGIDRLPAGIIK